MGLLRTFFGELDPHLTQCRLDRGLPPYQVASWSIQLFGHNRHGPKLGVLVWPPFVGGSGVPSSTMLPGPRPTSVQSVILIHPAVWLQQTWAENWSGAVPLLGRGSWVPIVGRVVPEHANRPTHAFRHGWQALHTHHNTLLSYWGRLTF